MGQRIYRVNPPDVAGEVFDAEDAERLVGQGIYSRRRPAPVNKPASKPASKPARPATEG